jgi:hypothetical protein
LLFALKEILLTELESEILDKLHEQERNENDH